MTIFVILNFQIVSESENILQINRTRYGISFIDKAIIFCYFSTHSRRVLTKIIHKLLI